MALITEATVKRVGRLARLALPEQDLSRLAGELNGILAWIDQLNEVDVNGVAPMTSVVDAHMTLRADTVTEGGDPARVLANAPKAEDGFFVVPKVVE